MIRIIAAILCASAAYGQEAYQRGEDALRSGDLAVAERAFRETIAQDAQSVGAHANLAVVFMRRHQWVPALDELRKAERLAPNVAGIRLNIGLVQYHRANYPDAIEAFASVLRDDPASVQARYWKGLCEFLIADYADAFAGLHPMFAEQSGNLQYLYALGIAAAETGHPEVERTALLRLMKVGGDAPELHLLLGKAHLFRDEDEEALVEFEKAAKGDPKLPFAHYYLGVAARRKQNLERARAEFLADIAVEPDIALDYEQLGDICAIQGADRQAEDYYRQALKLEPRLVTSHYALAKLYKKDGKLTDALAEADAAAAEDAQSASVHYLRAQILQGLHRTEEAKIAFAHSAELRRKVRDDLEQKISGRAMRDPL